MRGKLLTRRDLISDDSLMPDHPADTTDQPEDVATLRAALLAAEARIAALEQIIHSFKMSFAAQMRGKTLLTLKFSRIFRAAKRCRLA
jgi:hypothetical protein